jgi:hypothetical protein
MRVSPRRRHLMALFALCAVALAACSSSGDSDSSDDAVPTDEVETTTDGEGLPIDIVDEEERDFGLAIDPRTDNLLDAARAHFGDRFAGSSFDIPDDGPPTMAVHVVDARDADRDWLRDQAAAIEPGWRELVDVVNAERSLDELTVLLETVMERLGAIEAESSLQLDLAGNRIIVNSPTFTPEQRDQVRDGLAPGSVVFTDEIVDEDDEED